MIETKDLILGKAKMQDLESIFNNYWRHAETAKYMFWSPCKKIWASSCFFKVRI